MLQIIVEPDNPLDLDPDELKEVAEKIASLDPGFDVRIAGEGYAAPALTLWEVFSVWLPEAVKVSWPILVPAIRDIFVAWAKERFKRNPARRPKCVRILGPDGKVIASVVVKDSSSEPEDITSQQDAMNLPRKRPPLN